jgi:hypothetical protein
MAQSNSQHLATVIQDLANFILTNTPSPQQGGQLAEQPQQTQQQDQAPQQGAVGPVLQTQADVHLQARKQQVEPKVQQICQIIQAQCHADIMKESEKLSKRIAAM